MNFENWYDQHVNSVWRALPWIKDDLKDAYMAGRKSVGKPRPVAAGTQPAQSVDVDKVREVIAALVANADDLDRIDVCPMLATHLRNSADKLTAALQEKGNPNNIILDFT